MFCHILKIFSSTKQRMTIFPVPVFLGLCCFPWFMLYQLQFKLAEMQKHTADYMMLGLNVSNVL